MQTSAPKLTLLSSPDWQDYELIDSGGGKKLERYGPYKFVRPEAQAIWKPALSNSEWQAAHAIFQPSGGESGGTWQFIQSTKPSWIMRYKDLRLRAFASGSRHMGVFPEQAVQWDWIRETLSNAQLRPRILNLFGYTGMASLAAAQAGASVTHVDASKKAIKQGQENQSLSGLNEQGIRWLVDDAYKFVRREIRRGSKYEGLILDPPKFGRGPQGQVWELFDSLPSLLEDCRSILSDRPVFVLLTAYAIRASALSTYYALQDIIGGMGGCLDAGELVIKEKSAGRLLSTAIYARWTINTQASA